MQVWQLEKKKTANGVWEALETNWCSASISHTENVFPCRSKSNSLKDMMRSLSAVLSCSELSLSFGNEGPAQQVSAALLAALGSLPAITCQREPWAASAAHLISSRKTSVPCRLALSKPLAMPGPSSVELLLGPCRGSAAPGEGVWWLTVEMGQGEALILV